MFYYNGIPLQLINHFRVIKDITPELIETELEILGVVGMMDPPREEAKTAVDLCKSAGIKPVMITGDHKSTATAIALRLGILSEENKNQVLNSSELDKMEEKFESKDWVSLVIDMSLSRETAFNWLKEVQTIGMIKKIKHGHYMKSGMKI